MKKTAILIATACLFLAACKKASNPPATSLIVGKWTHTKDVVSNYDANGKFVRTDNADYSKSADYWQFNADNSGVIHEETYIGSGQYNTNNFTYTLVGSILNLTAPGTTQTDNVTTLTSSSMVIHADYPTKDSKGNLQYTDKVDMYFTK